MMRVEYANIKTSKNEIERAKTLEQVSWYC